MSLVLKFKNVYQKKLGALGLHSIMASMTCFTTITSSQLNH